MEKGIFITLEGAEGVGKTTQIEYVAENLRAHGHTVTLTREPGGTSVGESIRNILLSGVDLDICDETELLLIFAARAQHIKRVIKPALQRNEIVVCDRFTDASFAYQGGGRGIADEKIQLLQDWVQDSLNPDLTLLLDAPVEIGMERAGKRGELDRFESEDLRFFESIREKYLELAQRENHRIVTIDASVTLEMVQQQINQALSARNYFQ